jgi:hypothetical protein
VGFVGAGLGFWLVAGVASLVGARSGVFLGCGLLCLLIASGWVSRPIDLGSLRAALELRGVMPDTARTAALALYVSLPLALTMWAAGLFIHG